MSVTNIQLHNNHKCWCLYNYLKTIKIKIKRLGVRSALLLLQQFFRGMSAAVALRRHRLVKNISQDVTMVNVVKTKNPCIIFLCYTAMLFVY